MVYKTNHIFYIQAQAYVWVILTLRALIKNEQKKKITWFEISSLIKFSPTHL